MTIEPASDGWFITRDNRYIHLNQQWLNEMFHHQVKPRQAKDPETGRPIMAEGEKAFHRLRYLILSKSDDADAVAREFEDFYDTLVQNRQERANRGMKAITKDGDEDLRAVRDGAPVRPWNSTQARSELHDWIKQRKGRGRAQSD